MKKSIILILTLVLAVSITASQKQKMIIKVISPEAIWFNSTVDRTLQKIISRNKNIEVLVHDDNAKGLPSFPIDYLNFDSLYNWGAELGARYVVMVEIESNEIEKRKTFSFPFLVNKYQTVGIIVGELRIIDIKRGKLLTSEPFQIEQNGPSVIHTTLNNDINDPDLNIAASKKVKFFKELDKKLTKHLIKRIKAVTGGR